MSQPRDIAVAPPGGKGASSRCSRVYYLPPNCSDLVLDGTPPSGALRWLHEQVTRIEINSQVSVRKYGHDKSYCAQDSTTGLRSWDGTLTTKVQCMDNAFSLHAGQIIWLSIYPLGLGTVQSSAQPLEGYALIERDPIVCNLENGDPVEHNYTFSSKGLWNIPAGVEGTFDCCGCCEAGAGGGGGGSGGGGSGGSGGSGGGGSAAIPAEVAGLDGYVHTPVTAYQWNGTAWISVLDECHGGFIPGPEPTTPGTFAGQMTFVECEIG